jgi:hypothetical protein
MGLRVGLDECGKSETPRPGSGAPGRAEQLKIFTRNWKKLALSCTVTWTWSKKVTLLQSTDNDSTEKHKNLCSTVGPLAPFRKTGSR